MLQACWEVKKEYVPNNSTLREASGVMMIKGVGGRILSLNKRLQAIVRCLPDLCGPEVQLLE